MPTIEELRNDVRQAALAKRLTLTKEERLGNGYGWQLRFKEGPIICIYDNGKIVLQGTKHHLVKDILAPYLDDSTTSTTQVSRNVFVVYGHDSVARVQLEAMLRRWGFETILLDQLTSEGQTLIEKLERYQGQASYAVVLATPDDEGHRAGRSHEKLFRVRQNVVLELGMMLAHLGRSKVAILMKDSEDAVLERPSDINGLLYIRFTDAVDEAKVSLAQEMDKQGLAINWSKL
jgi:predicted nucleotide-binding protein